MTMHLYIENTENQNYGCIADVSFLLADPDDIEARGNSFYFQTNMLPEEYPMIYVPQ